jgi:putative ABC transport system permease protein
VVSEILAKKIFGNESALDKQILISQGGDPVNYKITGVYRPNKSFLEVNGIMSIISPGVGEYVRTNPEASKEWAGQNFVGGYLKLVPGHSKEIVERKLNEILVKYGSEDMKALGISKKLFLEPVKDIYLRSMVDTGQRITYIYVIVSIAAFVLILACINFMNLSTAKATKRAAEIGIRKVMGAFRGSLIRQILGEAMIIVAISMFISCVLVYAALPAFNELSGKNISFGDDNITFFVIVLLLLTFTTGLLAGSYPAFYMSSFQPAEVLKGKFSLGNASGYLRQGLVVFQFVVAIGLVFGVLVISRQLSYMKEKDLGFDPEAKILIPLRTNEAKTSYNTLKTSIEQLSSVKAVSGTLFPPGTQIFMDMLYYPDGGSMETAILNRRNPVDAGYIELLGIQLLAGRSFTSNREAESQGNVIINRTSAQKFGFEPEEAVGKKLHFDWQGQHNTVQVIGVMEDYNQATLKSPVLPAMFDVPGNVEQYGYLIANVNPEGFANTLTTIETLWKQHVSDAPFEYTFLDENIEKQYKEDERVAKIISHFATIAMIICCLGLYGLSSFMAERRLKEIGIRKVMGASTTQIVTMMSKEFVKLVLIAFIIAAPLGWYSMTKWLQGFEYKVTLDALPFAYAGGVAFLVALLTISFESLRAANTDPARTLRNE